jgi:uncharacterized membrane protein (DUF485 family)
MEIEIVVSFMLIYFTLVFFALYICGFMNARIHTQTGQIEMLYDILKDVNASIKVLKQQSLK